MTTPAPPATLLERLEQQRLVAIVRAPEAATAAARIERLLHAGAQVVEISLSTPDALSALARLLPVARAASALLGVGTVLTAAQLDAAADAGASFAVTPTTDPDVMTAAERRDMPIVPGAATPTEVHRASMLGATAVKLFPASLWSLRAFTDLRQVFPGVLFVPTGGVSAQDAPQWIEAGALAVGLGSAVTNPDADLRGLLSRLQETCP